MINNRRYVIISPCRDEEEFCRVTLDSVVSQTILPAAWIIVDGSSDNTLTILEEYAQRYDFIKVIHEKEGGHRQIGAGVVEAFNKGLACVNLDDFQYLCKLDMDLELPPAYFENLMKRMEAKPRIGTCSGKPYFRDSKTGRLISEKMGDWSSVGMAKFYRVECFKEIGGFIKQLGWDSMDAHHCRMKGWQAFSWDDPDIRFTECRMAGASHRGILTGRVRAGHGSYIAGWHPAYMFFASIYRSSRQPILIGGLAYFWGYLTSALKRSERYDDLEARRFMRRFQLSCLLRGRRKATQILDEKQAAVFERLH